MFVRVCFNKYKFPSVSLVATSGGERRARTEASQSQRLEKQEEFL